MIPEQSYDHPHEPDQLEGRVASPGYHLVGKDAIRGRKKHYNPCVFVYIHVHVCKVKGALDLLYMQDCWLLSHSEVKTSNSCTERQTFFLNDGSENQNTVLSSKLLKN